MNINKFIKHIKENSITIEEINFKKEINSFSKEQIAKERFEKWCKSSSNNDLDLFKKRLERDELKVEDVLLNLCNQNISENKENYAEWLDDLEWISKSIFSENNIKRSMILNCEQLPFEDIYLGLIEGANKLIFEKIDRAILDTVSNNAIKSLNFLLAGKICDLTAPIIFDEFLTYINNNSNPSYAEFIDSCKKNRLFDVFVTYPVLIRLICILTRQWIESTSEMLERLLVDKSLIELEFKISPTEFVVESFIGDLSDSHNNGKSVHILRLKTDLKILYKPKRLDLDNAWFNLIEKLNRDAPTQLHSPKIIPRSDYGWTEYISHQDCISPKEIELFFERSGAWLALFYIFSATDMHHENMIADGSHPIPIDFEMLLQGSSPELIMQDEEYWAENRAHEKIFDSVLMTGLLPTYSISPQKKIVEIGGLNSDGDEKRPVSLILKWRDINTINMNWERVPQISSGHTNMPMLNGEYPSLGKYLEFLIKGFKTYSRFLISQKDSIDIFSGFDGLSVRKVIKPTRFYYLLVQRLCDYRAMKDSISWSAQADFISRLADWSQENDKLWGLQKSERKSLLNLDIPYFLSSTEEDLIYSLDGTQIKTGYKPGLILARERLFRYDENQIEWQIELIRQSTTALTTKFGGERTFRSAINKSSDNTEKNNFLLSELHRIFDFVQSKSIESKKSAAWIGLDWLGHSDVCKLITLGSDLYNGITGISLFLAAYSDFTGDKEAKKLYEKSISSLYKKLDSQTSRNIPKAIGIGGATGLGSVIYALASIHKILNDDQSLKYAYKAANLISISSIKNDKALDVINGTAGLIISLAALYRIEKNKNVSQLISICADHLLNMPRGGEIGQRSWRVNDELLNGFSHGAAGFSYALSVAAKITNNNEYLNAALEAIHFENSSYSEDEKNWLDFRGQTPDKWTSQWCHGGVGIGLSRLALLKYGLFTETDKADIEIDVRRALQSAEYKWPNYLDTLCCGTLGAVELLKEASLYYKQKDLDNLSQEKLLQIIENSKQKDYEWGFGSQEFNLGLFRGLTGVGYTILRQMETNYPNVLIWE